MPIDKDLEQALEALARSEGKSTKDLVRELVRERIGRGPEPEPEAKSMVHVGTGDASGARRAERAEAIERHHAEEFPGSPVVRYRRDPYAETPAEAQERWLEEEAELPDGVHGIGGQSAGGIFGDAPVATSIYDPMAMARSEGRVGQMVNVRMLQVLDRMERRLEAAETRELPSGQARKRLRGR